MASDGNDRSLQIWALPLAAGVLPALGAIVAVWLSMRLGLVDACNPLFSGCVSVSRAARHDLPNHIFRALVLPGAVLQCLTWVLCRDWLLSLGAKRRLQLLPWLGGFAAIFLVLYGTFLGTEGRAYRWLRIYGTIGYFGLSYLCLLIAAGEIGRLARVTAALRSWRADRVLLSVCILLLLIGLINAFVAPHFASDTKNRIGNVAEWWLGVGFTLCFLVLALLWKRTQFAVQPRTKQD